MATRYWEGGGTDNTDLADATNWSGNTLPGNGDTAIIASRPSTETGPFTASATLPASGTLTVFSVGREIISDFSTAAGSALTVNATTMNLNGWATYAAFNGTQTTVNVNNVAIGEDVLNLSGTITTLRILSGEGEVTVADSSTATNIEMIDAPNVTLTVGTSVTNTSIIINSGFITTSSNIAGTVTSEGGTLTVAGSATCATINLHTGGAVKYNSSGTLTTLTIYGGIMDLIDSTASSVTITNATLYEGGTIDERSGLSNVVYTNGITTRGGIIRSDAARTVTVT